MLLGHTAMDGNICLLIQELIGECPQHVLLLLKHLLVLGGTKEEVLAGWTTVEDVVVLSSDLWADQVLEALLVVLDEQVVGLGILSKHTSDGLDLLER